MAPHPGLRLVLVSGIVVGARVYRPQVCEERAELARLRSDEAACTRELREALRLYTEMGATGHAERLAREQGA